MFYGLDLDRICSGFKKDWIQKRFQRMPCSALRFSESRLKSPTMKKYRDEAGLRFFARGFLVENISLGCWALVNLNIHM
jgi:hypothetical protein